MLACLNSLNTDMRMMMIGCGDDHGIDIVAVEQVLIMLIALYFWEIALPCHSLNTVTGGVHGTLGMKIEHICHTGQHYIEIFVFHPPGHLLLAHAVQPFFGSKSRMKKQ